MKYVFIDQIRNQYACLDQPSGGYDYYSDSIFDARIWTDKKEAFKWKKAIGNNNLLLVEVIEREEVIKLLNKAKNALNHSRQWIKNLKPDFQDNGIYSQISEEIELYINNH